jgi:uncharacterized membrane protein
MIKFAKKTTMKVSTITQNALIASLYIILTVLPPFNALAYGPIQFRISEALLVFGFLRKDWLLGLIIGTFFANLFGPLGGGFALIDAVFGSLITGLSLWVMIHLKNVWLTPLAPILLNGIYLSLFLPFAFELPFTLVVIVSTFASVAAGEAVVLYALGIPLYFGLISNPNLRHLLGIHHGSK